MGFRLNIAKYISGCHRAHSALQNKSVALRNLGRQRTVVATVVGD